MSRKSAGRTGCATCVGATGRPPERYARNVRYCAGITARGHHAIRSLYPVGTNRPKRWEPLIAQGGFRLQKKEVLQYKVQVTSVGSHSPGLSREQFYCAGSAPGKTSTRSSLRWKVIQKASGSDPN
jgi:hypothetical protein